MGGVCGIGSIKGHLSPIGSLIGNLSVPIGGLNDLDIYLGPYHIVSTDKEQILPTANKFLEQDIVIEANSTGIPEGSEMATDADVNGVIDSVFGPDVKPNPDNPTYDASDIATQDELNATLTDVFGKK